MENIKKEFNLQLFADEGTETGAETSGNDTQSSQQTINYEEEYKKMLLENDKLRESVKKSNSENAEYKRREREKMSNEEKSAQDYKELVESKKGLEARLASYELKETLIDSGFDKDEIKTLMDDNCSPAAYAKVFEERVKQLEKKLKADGIKTSTPASPLGNNISKSEEKSTATKLAEKRFANDTSRIKDFYKK